MAVFKKLAETALHAVGGVLNGLAAVDETDPVFLPDEEDDKAIPPPLARIAARRINLPVDDENVKDAEDLVGAAIAVGAWLLRGLVDVISARRARRKLVAGAALHPGDQNGAAPSEQ